MTVVRYWAVIPAAGSGTRMKTTSPKQYLPLHGKPILEHVIIQFCDHPKITGVVVAIAGDDQKWATLAVSTDPKVRTVTGGKMRCDSVLNGLRALVPVADEYDWVLVHDAARPCLSRQEIDRLITTLDENEVGGLLALPVRDTMKRASSDLSVDETIDRCRLWHALTPQMFRLGVLLAALERASVEQIAVTDESQAVEMNGLRPLLVEGCVSNIKVTHADDLAIAELLLSKGGR